MPVPPAGEKFRHVLGTSLSVLLALPIVLSVVVPLAIPDTARAQSAPATASLRAASQTPDNPLANRRWGVYKGPLEHSWHAYRTARGQQRELLAKIALRPKATWFGQWLRTDRVAENVREYILNSQHGDPDALVQMAIFAMQPWEREACNRLPTAAETERYKTWIDQVAAAIGDAHVALVLQPDAPFALCAPHGSGVLLDLIRYATERFARQPYTSVYIEAGAADWMRDDPAKALRILVPAGIRSARGFALNSTHYDSTARQIRFAAAISEALTARGIPGKYAVINTAQNGKPFKGYEYRGPNFDNARACTSLDDSRCVTLGIPPTTDVASPAWGLAAADAADAAAYVDGYLWFGRPWLYNQGSGWDHQRALTIARTTQYPGP
jgi:endoglucanase